MKIVWTEKQTYRLSLQYRISKTNVLRESQRTQQKAERRKHVTSPTKAVRVWKRFSVAERVKRFMAIQKKHHEERVLANRGRKTSLSSLYGQ